MRLKPGASLVGMTVLQPELAAQVRAAQAAAKAAAAAAADGGGGGAAAKGAGSSSSSSSKKSSNSSPRKGPWLLLVTAGGFAKRITLLDARVTGRGVSGLIGMKLNAGGSAAWSMAAADRGLVQALVRSGVLLSAHALCCRAPQATGWRRHTSSTPRTTMWWRRAGRAW
jgi:hypothetical protein